MIKESKEFHVSRMALVAIAMMSTSMGSAFAAPITNDMNMQPTSLSVSAQQEKVTINGVVSDAMGPMAGVNVIEKGTTNGTITDLNGNFTLKVEPNSTLVVSFIGYQDQEINVGNKTNFTITMKEDTQALEEVVVVGYGTQKKVNLSGSVASVNIGEMTESRPLTSLSTALAGTASGVQVTASNNSPANNGDADIKVRGQGTLNNAAPLVIIDGVEGSMSSVSPQDIETISVLKDAASSAIYGSRAANGVILVTTKSGKAGKMKLEYNGYVSFETLNRPFDLVTDYAHSMELMNEGYTNKNMPAPFSQEKIDLWREKSKDPNGLTEQGIPNRLAYPNSDIFDVYETGVSHQHNISASGGTEKIRFYSSFNFLDNPGILENTGYKRYGLRTNLDAQVTKWLKLGVNLNGYIGETTPVNDNLGDIYNYGLSNGNPGVAYIDDQGRLGVNANNEDDPQNAANNPYLRLRNTTGTVQTNSMKSRFYAQATPLKGLTLQASYSYEFYDKQKEDKPVFVPLYNFLTNTLHTDGVSTTSITNTNEKHFRHFMDATVNYSRDFLDNKLSTNILLGASQEQYTSKSFRASRKDLIDPSLGVIDGATGESSSIGNMTSWAMHSYFGRINLGWEDKYLVEANLRVDGSSRFLSNNRWGWFPSFSAAWRMSQEEFMKDIDWLSNFKIRTSYGSLGNNSVGNYDSQSLYSQTNYVLGRSVAMGLSQKSLANAALTWETTRVANVGVDFGLFNNRLSGTIEYFHKQTKDILIDLPAPMVHGNATLPKQNSAQVTNKGLEFSLQWNDKIGDDFSYNAGFNFTYIKNNVDKFKGDEASYANNRILIEGQPIWSLYVLEADRIIQTDADLEIVNKMLSNPNIPEGQKVFPYGTPEKGDILYKDLNGDGMVNDNDRTVVGTGQNPKFSYGGTVGFGWKGIDFSALFQGQAGLKDIYYSNQFKSTVRLGGAINKEVAEGRWYEGRTDASYPRLLQYSDVRNERMSDFWVASKSYFKIRNITLGYTLPSSWTQRLFMNKIRLYGSLENFFTFTKWKGYDPEINGLAYPSMRQAVIGVNLTF